MAAAADEFPAGLVAARLAAAQRALDERLHPPHTPTKPPLLHDPLAAVLAGGEEELKRLAAEWQQQLQCHQQQSTTPALAAAGVTGAGHPAANITTASAYAAGGQLQSQQPQQATQQSHLQAAVRARLVDGMLGWAVNITRSRCPRAVASRGSISPAAELAPQVVNLGAGMDARPWRLSTRRRQRPGDEADVHDVCWFDVDRSDVLLLKRRLLLEAGAQLSPKAAAAAEEPAGSNVFANTYIGGGATGAAAAALLPTAGHSGRSNAAFGGAEYDTDAAAALAAETLIRPSSLTLGDESGDLQAAVAAATAVDQIAQQQQVEHHGMITDTVAAAASDADTTSAKANDSFPAAAAAATSAAAALRHGAALGFDTVPPGPLPPLHSTTEELSYVSGSPLALAPQVAAAHHYPLRCGGGYIPVVCNLEQPFWLPDALTAGGFTAKAPTVWLAEGVLPLLTPASTAELLRLMAELSPSGTKLLFTHVDDATLRWCLGSHQRQALVSPPSPQPVTREDQQQQQSAVTPVTVTARPQTSGGRGSSATLSTTTTAPFQVLTASPALQLRSSFEGCVLADPDALAKLGWRLDGHPRSLAAMAQEDLRVAVESPLSRHPLLPPLSCWDGGASRGDGAAPAGSGAPSSSGVPIMPTELIGSATVL